MVLTPSETRVVLSRELALCKLDSISIVFLPLYVMQVGGWSQVYQGLTLVIVTGAGHEVPLHRPRQAFILFRSFLENKPMPT